VRSKLFLVLLLFLLMPTFAFAVERSCPFFSIFDPLESVKCTIESVILDTIEGVYSYMTDLLDDASRLDIDEDEIIGSFLFDLSKNISLVFLLVSALYYVLRLIVGVDVWAKGRAKNMLFSIGVSVVLIQLAPALITLVADVSDVVNGLLSDSVVELFGSEIEVLNLFSLEGASKIAVYTIHTVFYSLSALLLSLIFWLNKVVIFVILAFSPFILAFWNIGVLKLFARFLGYYLFGLICYPFFVKLVFLAAKGLSSGSALGTTLGFNVASTIAIALNVGLVVVVLAMTFLDSIKGMVRAVAGAKSFDPISLVEGIKQAVRGAK